MGLAMRILNRVGRNLMPLSALFLAIAIAVVVGRVYGVLPPPPEMSHEVSVLVAGAVFSPGAVVFGALFWKYRSQLFFMCMLVFIIGMGAAMVGVHFMETNDLALGFLVEPDAAPHSMECSPVSGAGMPDGAVLCVP